MSDQDDDDLALFEDVDDAPAAHDGELRLNCLLLRTRLEMEAAVYALRMIDGGRWHQRLIRRGRIDDDVLGLVGLKSDDSHGSRMSVTRFQTIIARHLSRMEKRLQRRSDGLARNIQTLGRALKLNPTERAVLRLAVVATRIEDFAELFSQALKVKLRVDVLRAVRHATGCRMGDVQRALANNSPLRRSGFLGSDDLSCCLNPLAVESPIVEALLAPRLDGDEFLRRLARPSPCSRLSMADFDHVADLALVRRYLAKAAARRDKGVNVLIYGATGTGKTEFARALGAHLGLDLYEVPNEDREGNPISGESRFSAYAICQHLLASRRRKLVVFDEVEDVFGSEDVLFAAYGRPGRTRNAEQLRKSWINETLECNPVPAIWISNSIAAMDVAFLRRFDLVVELGAPSRAVRRRMIDRYFRPSEISAACANRLAAIEHLPPAQIERAARVVRSLETPHPATRDTEAERIVSSSLRAMGRHQPIPPPALPEYYDPAFVNADCDIEEMSEGLRGTPGARLCLYGPPGTGKTAFAHHLGQVLDRPVTVKRGSDLLSMWVGQTEELIAAAFREARDTNAILVIDEADGFLRDRDGATQRWEVTQVNELLTQMEAFDGIFVASTNLVDTLDAASLRRFDFKVKFDFLNREQRRAMLRRVCSSSGRPATEIELGMAAIDRIEHLTPGDFANVLRQVRVTGGSPTAARIVELLRAEVAMKPGARQRAIGFTAGLAARS